jgi:hypothetical protein
MGRGLGFITIQVFRTPNCVTTLKNHAEFQLLRDIILIGSKIPKMLFPPLFQTNTASRGLEFTKKKIKIMTTARDTIVDALDIESFVLCESEKEAKELVGKLMQSLGLSRFVIVSLDFNGPGAHFRVRAYMNKPGDNYTWLKE